MFRLIPYNEREHGMDFGSAKVLAVYLGASALALAVSVNLACMLGGQAMVSFSGSFFR